ncbi:hypothetical protein ABZX65_36220 [Streptomyces sp. NPDC003300]|uniref:hypothetical protein n=1 Tax=unclassified Streptomyces TaxID=2593676 RepID=UPI0033B01D90
MIPDVPRLSRRSVVAVAAVVVSAGCSGGGGTAGSDGAGHKATLPEPGELALRQAVRDSAALLARYDAVAAAYPALAGRLAPLRAEVALHMGAFGGRAAPVPTGSPSPGATSAATPASSPSAALKSLADEERRLADSRATALLNVPGETARLFASVAAAGAGHVALLGTKGAVR